MTNRQIIDKDICTRDNIYLDLLLDGSVDDVSNGILQVIEET